MRKFAALLLAAVLCFCTTAYAGDDTVFTEVEPLDTGGSLEHFVFVNEADGCSFSDVDAEAWYAESVKTAYALGLVMGKSETVFDPEGSVTLAEAITLAARLRGIYETGKGSFAAGEVWYQVYVDYAVDRGIIYDGQFADYLIPATRAEFAVILKNALPKRALPAINCIEPGDIPDVELASGYANAVYFLYNAGILAGNDALGTFAPDSEISRAAVAAIVTRMADPALRVSVELGE